MSALPDQPLYGSKLADRSRAYMLILSLGNSFSFKGLLRCMKIRKYMFVVFTGLHSKFEFMQVGP